MRLKSNISGVGPPVVFLHAFPLSSAMWERQAGIVAASGMSAVSIDFPGFGIPPAPGRTDVLADAARDVAETLDSLGIDQASFVGISMGGYVFFELLADHRERIKAAVLCDTTASGDTPEKRAARLDLIRAIKENGTRVLEERMLPNLVTKSTRDANGPVMTLLRRHIECIAAESAASALKAMAERADRSSLLESVDFPLLFLFGREDAITGESVATEMHSRVPVESGARLVFLPGAGHLSNLEKPESFDRELIAFLRAVTENQ